MRVHLFSLALVAVLLGTGCAKTPETGPAPSPAPPTTASADAEKRITATPLTQPVAEPEIPSSAKNVPRPVIK
ncbi:hypothetical protein HZC53_03235 [Candidatus Uhrbacteria bacterium]|nr:hypothetical protein [Candidatus Uhrbacteria bacterium]